MKRAIFTPMSKTVKPLRLLLVGFLCASLLLLPVQKASAGLVEYSFLLAFLAIVVSVVPQADLPSGANVVVNQLETAVEGARAANIVGNRVTELSRLSKAIGAAEALMGMSSTCSDCDQLKETLQQIIGQASQLKVSAGGGPGTCHPNGVVEPNEECDPLVIPTGCPITPTAVTYCSDECRCVATINP